MRETIFIPGAGSGLGEGPRSGNVQHGFGRETSVFGALHTSPPYCNTTSSLVDPRDTPLPSRNSTRTVLVPAPGLRDQLLTTGV